MRRLSPDEAALWRRVAGTVRPTKRAPVHSLAVRAEPVERPFASATVQPKTQGAISTRSGRTVSSAATRDTLDGSWDRKIGTGRITPDRAIDLHGLNLAGAHRRLEHALELAVRDGVRVILLVTGRPARADASRIDLPLRGIIRESVRDWLAASRHSGSIAAVRNAHPRHGGAGALYLILRRPHR